VNHRFEKCGVGVAGNLRAQPRTFSPCDSRKCTLF
jgi:hypothetical protein